MFLRPITTARLPTTVGFDERTVASLRRLWHPAGVSVLVTGRELPELHVDLFTEDRTPFEWVVAENGGLLYRPATREEQPLAGRGRRRGSSRC